MPTASPSPAPRKSQPKLAKLIEKYYADLAELAHQNVLYEMGTRPAFHALLAAAGRDYGWTLIAEHEKKVNGKTIRPDGTFKDEMNLVRGYWEAKDTADKLDAEIEKKRKAGYPLNNIIFEDTATAILYQHGQRLLAADMKDPQKLAELVTEFFRYVEPEIQEFEEAVNEFKERVPDLAEGLAKKIAQAHKANPAFKEAFAAFFQLCQTSLNPNLSQAAVDEMLIQHILTERLIREIFDNPEFVRRNVIAAEVEKVMQAMTSQAFDRNTYLKDLDRFYVAIEKAARTMQDWSDKQYFLNTVYERFFQGYSVKLADTMGIVYTPQEIVDFMCASVAEVLEKEFGKKLWSDDVYIIDPCTGTGNFIVNLIRRIPKAKLEDVYKHRLFANEIMLLPYYIAALNIEHAYFEQAGKYESFEGLCFVDTLDMAEHAQGELSFMTAKNSERVARQKKTPITVVIGNPPYNQSQQDENDNNRNRGYPAVDGRISETFAKDSRASLRMQLYDPYVRFFRWAIDRLEGRDGVVAFVTNNGFVQGTSFDSFRRAVLHESAQVYHLDLRGNARTTGEERRKESGNIFSDQIRVGIGITIIVKQTHAKSHSLHYHRVADYLDADQKKALVAEFESTAKVPWSALSPIDPSEWIRAEGSDTFRGWPCLGDKESKNQQSEPPTIFKTFCPGIKTGRDEVVYDFDADALTLRSREFADTFNGQVDRLRRQRSDVDIDEFVDRERIQWSETLKGHLKRGTYIEVTDESTARSIYRPFTTRHLFFHPVALDRSGIFPRIFPLASGNKRADNNVLWLKVGPNWPIFVLNSRLPVDHLPQGGSQCFPFYVYDEDGANRRENITDWALDQFRTHYKDKKIDKWAIFHYVYGLLHHPGYREKFADNLKRELPRIPFAPDFKAFADAGKQLAKLHLDYESLKPWDLDFQETPGLPLSYRVDDKMRLSKDKSRLIVNPTLALAGIPTESFDYRLGNRSALEWVIDQYQLSTDKRSGIVSDPNRADDPQYIVRLVGQVIRVSIETMKIVNGLPTEFADVNSAPASARPPSSG